jgi:hypothetical protein
MKKAPSNKSTAVESSQDSAIRILKDDTCPSLSGKSTLTYHVGCNAKSELLFRVYENSGSGFFSSEWISINKIKQVSDKVPSDQAITSFILNPLFTGKSVNTPSFLFAILKQEGFVQPSKAKPRCYERIDPKRFIAEITALMNTPVALKDSDKPKKAAVGKKAAPGKIVASKTGSKKVSSPTPA